MNNRAAMLCILLLAAVTNATAQDDVDFSARSALDDTALVKSPNFLRAAGETIGLNVLVWSFDRYIREGGENPVFRFGFNSWKENLAAGWTWDDNSFSTNQFSHPYHGSLYFNAARSNGYDFWGSVPFAFVGSWTWEYLFEVHNPSMNDWIATAVGGTALGEMFHRLGKVVRDNTATGSSRRWSEVGGFFIDPVGGLNRIIDGDWSRQYANDPDRFPSAHAARLDAGLRTRGEEKLWKSDTTEVFIEFEMTYGDPFAGDIEGPFDHFDFTMQVNLGDKSSIGRIEGSGILGAKVLREGDGANHILAAFHHYDYVNSYAIEFGGQTLTAGLLSRFPSFLGLETRTAVHLGPIILGGTSSDYESVSARSYDYGPGMAALLAADFGRYGHSWLRLSHEQFWLHSISGNDADHHNSATRARLQVPVRFNVSLGAEYVLLLSERRYGDFPDISARRPQSRIFFTWSL